MNSVYRWLDKFHQNHQFAIWQFFAMFVAVYWFTSTGNLSETDDVYAFIYRTEHFPFSQVSDPRLMLYHMAMRGLYLSVNGFTSLFSYEVTALTTMRCFSIVCAALTLRLAFRILIKHFDVSQTAALSAVLFLAFSYGYWRYAAEAEVYIPACLLILWVYDRLLDAPVSGTNLMLIAFVAGATVLFYQPSVIPLFFAFPFLFNVKREWKSCFVYLFVGGVTVLAGYIWGFSLYWDAPLSVSEFQVFLSQRSEEFMLPSMSLKTVIFSVARSGFSLMHDFASANWVFASQPVLVLVEKMFPQNVIAEEVYLASQVGWRLYLLIFTQGMLGLMILALIIQGLKRVKKVNVSRGLMVLIVWLAINGAIIGRLNPAGIEAWIMVFPPLMILVGVVILNVLPNKFRALIFASIGVLVFHNIVGGLSLVWDESYEYHKVKGKWAIEQGSSKDLIVVTGDAGFAETLRYLSASKVVYLSVHDQLHIGEKLYLGRPEQIQAQTWGRDFTGESVARVIQDTWENGGRLMVFEDFFYAGVPSPGSSLWKLKDISQRVYEPDDVFATYVVAKREPK